MKRTTFLCLFFMLLSTMTTFAQCAMCRATLENNFSNGKPGIASGLNVGILYLLIMPYLAATVLGYLWYKTSKAHGKKNKLSNGVNAR